MRHPKPIALARILILAVFAAACDRATEPEDTLGGLDPAAVEAAVNGIAVPMQASSRARNLLSGLDSVLADLGVQFQAVGATPRMHRSTPALLPMLLPPTGPRLHVPFPPEIRGRTLVFDAGNQRWEFDDDRTGAPQTGIRVIYYETEPWGDFSLPLTELGYIDLTDQDNGGMSRLGVQIVRTAGGAATLADYLYGLSETDTDSGWTDRGHLSGFFSDGTLQVDVLLDFEESFDDQTGIEVIDLEMAFGGSDGTLTLVWDGWFSEATKVSEDDIMITVARAGQSTVLALDIKGNPLAETITGTIHHDNTLVAHVAFAGDGFSFTRPDGGSFSQQQRIALDSMTFAMFFGVYALLGGLPLFFF